MKVNYIVDLTMGDELTNELFLLQDVGRRTTRDGRPFLLTTLRDRTGQIGSVFWNVPEYIEGWVKAGDPVLVTGRVVNYKDSLQINITDMNPGPDTADLTSLLPSSPRPQEEMIAELRMLITSLNEPWQTLVTDLLLDEQTLPRYANAPAARSMHHGYIGGLIEHSLSMASLANFLSEHYPHVNRDLLLTGTLLHDMGKIEEYDISDSFAMSEDGRLVGHIVRAIVQVEQAAAAINFPEEDLRHLVHLIASHHGTTEWGSPTVPKTLEAILLHQLDLLDSRVQGFFDHINNDNSNGEWTAQSSNMFRTELRRPPGMA